MEKRNGQGAIVSFDPDVRDGPRKLSESAVARREYGSFPGGAGRTMLKIEAIIRPEKLESVQGKLRRIGYPGMMVTEMEGHGRQKGLHPDWPSAMRVNFLPKTKLEIVVENKDKAKVIQAVVSGARTGEMGDGKIFVSEVKDAIRIRTGERGARAVSKKENISEVRLRRG
jgi:nitrogen regulatory protein P-II 1